MYSFFSDYAIMGRKLNVVRHHTDRYGTLKTHIYIFFSHVVHSYSLEFNTLSSVVISVAGQL